MVVAVSLQCRGADEAETHGFNATAAAAAAAAACPLREKSLAFLPLGTNASLSFKNTAAEITLVTTQ